MTPTVALRAQLRERVLLVLGPALSRVAALYRKIWIPECRIIVVIGSHGKTTTATVVAEALNCVSDSQLTGNIQALVALNLFRLRRGTPRAVLEVGIGIKGQMKTFARMLHPDVVVVTSIGREHQQNLGSLEDIRAEKAIMVEALGPEGLAVLNGDDPNVLWMESRTKSRVIRCGLNDENEVRATDVSLSYPPEMHLRLAFDNTQLKLTTPLLGHVMVFPVLAALAVGQEEGIAQSDLQRRLKAVQPVDRRMARVALPNQAWGIVDDRKSLPDTVNAALRTLAELPAERKWVVMGEIGMPPDHSIEPLYRSTGAALGRVCDKLVLTTGDPRKRDLFVAGATEAGLAEDHIASFDGSLQAVAEHLRHHLRPGDVVLFKGRFPERLVRIALVLEGIEVSCWVPRCGARMLECRSCPALTGR